MREIIKFWTWFIQHEQRFYQTASEDMASVIEEINERVFLVDPDVIIEIHPPVEEEPHKLIVSANGLRDAFPMVRQLAESAPDTPRWDVHAFRQRMEEDVTLFFEDKPLNKQDISFEYEPTDDGKLGIILYIDEFDKEMVSAVYILLDCCLGEYDVETKLSFVEFREKRNLGDREGIPLKELARVVDSHYS